METWIVCSGNPADGFTYYGPFDDHELAENWGTMMCRDGWWIISLVDPNTVEE